MRLIDADALMKRMCERCNEVMEDEPCEPSDCFVREIITSAPAIEAEPVRHGRWEKHHHSYFGIHQCTCSECKEDEYWKKYFCYGDERYCPNCGAKMDKEE